MNSSVIKHEFLNLLDEKIELCIENYHVRSQKMIVRRAEVNFWWFFKRFSFFLLGLFIILRICIFSVSFFSFKISLFNLSLLQNILESFLTSLLSCTILVYLLNLLPVIEESISFLHNLNGFEYEIRYLFQNPKRRFIPTKRIIINEGITMQRIIFYLCAIPNSMQSYVLEEHDHFDSDLKNKQKNSPWNDSSSSNIQNQNTIPLFIHVLPRLDCLKIIYQNYHKQIS